MHGKNGNGKLGNRTVYPKLKKMTDRPIGSRFCSVDVLLQVAAVNSSVITRVTCIDVECCSLDIPVLLL